MNDEEIEKLARSVAVLTGGAWGFSGLRLFLRNSRDRGLTGRTYAECAVALTYLALVTQAKGWGQLLTPGPWWTAAGVDLPASDPSPWSASTSTPSTSTSAGPHLEVVVARRSPRRGEDCPAHPGEWPGDACRGCAAERLEAPPGSRSVARGRGAGTDGPALARALIHAHRRRPGRTAVEDAASRPSRDATDTDTRDGVTPRERGAEGRLGPDQKRADNREEVPSGRELGCVSP